MDVDATDDLIHGNQEGRFFHGYYKNYCYLPLYIFCEDHLLCARLRPSNIDASEGTVEELERIVFRIRQRWSKPRRVVGKAEYLLKGANPRFVATSLSGDDMEAKKLYEEMYCARGNMENSIKEQQLYMFADRTSRVTSKSQ